MAKTTSGIFQQPLAEMLVWVRMGGQETSLVQVTLKFTVGLKANPRNRDMAV